MIKRCNVCKEEVDFGSNINATTCQSCINKGKKYCSTCQLILNLSSFSKAGKAANGSIRYSSECKQCAKKRNAAYYTMNAERIKTQTSAYRKANLSKYRNYSANWISSNKIRRRISAKASCSRYSKTSKGRDAINVSNARYRHANKGTLTAKQWKSIKELFVACAYCGKAEKLTIEHAIPVSSGGKLTAANVLPACQSCNSSRGNKDFSQWISNIAEERRAKIIWYLNEGHKTIE